jgi:hypothetical protein
MANLLPRNYIAGRGPDVALMLSESVDKFRTRRVNSEGVLLCATELVPADFGCTARSPCRVPLSQSLLKLVGAGEHVRSFAFLI